jgi:hypothetical protein
MNIYYDVEDNHYRTYPDGDIATVDQMRELIENKNLSIAKLQQENKKLNGAVQTYDILLKSNVEENKQLKDLIDTILNFSFFKEECPLNLGFENNTNEDKSQSIFYEDEWCENNCNDNYKDCWLKYFEKLQELEQGSDSNE